MNTKSNTPLVSVIIPVYNGELTIAKTIESVLHQTYTNLEIIVIDDCSTDNSRSIINSFSDSRIKKLFLDHNMNICAASNEGYKLVTGQFLAFIGHDDIWLPEKTEKQISHLMSNPETTVCFTRIDIIDENDNIVSDGYPGIIYCFGQPNMSQEETLHAMITKGDLFCAPTAITRTSLLNEVGLYRYGLVQTQDYDLWIRLLCKGPTHIIEEKLTYYRRFSDNTHNLSSISVEKNTRERHELHYIYHSAITEMDSDLFKRVFSENIRNKDAITQDEISCEKALILNDIGNCFAYKELIELFEIPECKAYLEEKCRLSLGDFYNMNTAPIRCDDTYYNLCLEQNKIISGLLNKGN